MNAHDPAWTQFIERARTASILDVAQKLTKLRREGRDWCGHCPAGCTKNGDGFVVTPSTGLFLCRPQDATGDVIDMVIHGRGCSFAEACEFIIGDARPDRSHDETPEQKAEREHKWKEAQIAAEKRAVDQAKAEAKKQAQTERAVADVLSRAVPIWGTMAEAYLRARKLPIQEKLCRDLLFVPDLDYWGFADPDTKMKTHLATLPAMVARFRDVAGNDGFAIHQTFLDPVEPRKWRPPVDPDRNDAKKARGSPKGGLIRLGRPTRCLAIAEGIETALGWYGLACGPEDVSIAAMCGKSRLPGVELPGDVREVILLGDGDDQRSAEVLIKAGRVFKAQGRAVSMHMCVAGADWADVAAALAGEEK